MIIERQSLDVNGNFINVGDKVNFLQDVYNIVNNPLKSHKEPYMDKVIALHSGVVDVKFNKFNDNVYHFFSYDLIKLLILW